MFQCIHQHTTGAKVNTFQIIDGADQVGGYVEDKCESNNTYYPVVIIAIDAVSSGTHTYTARWKTNAATATAAQRYIAAVAFSR